MCGICGAYNFNRSNLNAQALSSMAYTMNHRGPDDRGFLAEGHAGIGMCRLSIIDVEGGHQPIYNEDQSIAVVLNGEIYNYVELRQELLSRGHRFATHTDTEVLVHLYEEYGAECLSRLNGMFAFIIWDKRQDRFLIARDRLGIKPLYYFKNDSFFNCCSDLQGLRQVLPKEPTVNREGFLSYLVMAYVPGTDTIYDNVYKLSPGHYMDVTGEGITIHRYWHIDIQNPPVVITPQEACQQLEFLLKDAIRLQQRSDVPIGTFLSGGIDSSAVVALLSQAAQQPVRTFTVDFKGKKNNESSFARLVAKQYSSDHYQQELDDSDMAIQLQELIAFMDEPVCDSAVIPSYFLSKKAHERGVKVLLNGTGGDELFGGYLRHHPYNRWSKYRHIVSLPKELRNALSFAMSGNPHNSLVIGDERLYWGLTISGVDLTTLKSVLRDPKDFQTAIDILRERFSFLLSSSNRPYFSKMHHDMTNYMVGDVLSLLDKTTMACSIEGRVPLLDHRIAEFAFSIPEKVNILNGQPKGLLKAVVGKYLPSEIINRPKTGFNAPVGSLVNGGLRQPAFDQLKHSGSYLKSIVDTDKVGQLFASGVLSERSAEMIFSLYVFDHWYQKHHEG